MRFRVCLLALLVFGCGRDDSANIEPTHGVRFRNATQEFGIEFVHRTPQPDAYDLSTIMGSGCALFDFDRDGRLDIYFVNLGAVGEPSGNVLYRQKTDGGFEDVTQQTNAAGSGTGLGMGVAAGDINNDGFPDLYLTCFGADRLLLNEGGKSFKDVTESAAISNLRWGASVSFVDFDRDGWLDIFVSNYVDYTPLACRQLSGANQDFCGPHRFEGTSDLLLRNVTGDRIRAGHAGDLPMFEDVSARSRISSKSGPGLGVVCADFTNDGWPDLYVANDQAANFLWINQQDGTFKEEAIQRGCAYDMLGNAQASMGTAVGFLDDNPTPDILLTHLTGESNTLYVSDERGYFTDESQPTGIGDPAIPLTGFGTAFLDVNLDGQLDLITVNGAVKRPDNSHPGESRTAADFWSPYRQPHQLLLNSDRRFSAIANFAGLDANEVSRGLATGDIDGDGDVDVVVCNIGSRPEVLINESLRSGSSDSKSHYLYVSCVLPQSGNRDAIGAVVTVAAGKKSWRAVVQPGTSYLSSNDPRVHIGLGETSSIDHIDVNWPDGSVERFVGLELDRYVTLAQGQGRAVGTPGVSSE